MCSSPSGGTTFHSIDVPVLPLELNFIRSPASQYDSFSVLPGPVILASGPLRGDGAGLAIISCGGSALGFSGSLIGVFVSNVLASGMGRSDFVPSLLVLTGSWQVPSAQVVGVLFLASAMGGAIVFV